MRYILDQFPRLVKPGQKIPEGIPTVDVMTKEQYEAECGNLVHKHLLLRNMEHARYCRADLLAKCDIGTILIPDKKNILGKPFAFGYYMDRSRLVFLDEGKTVENVLKKMEEIRFQEETVVVHYFFEFLEYLILDDVMFLQRYDDRIAEIEDLILNDKKDQDDMRGVQIKIMTLRKELSKLATYYSQLLNMGTTLYENYNGVLLPEDRNLFRLFSDRVQRLLNNVHDLRDYAGQIRELYQTHLEMRQNNVISFLTVVTTIFMPLSLITGWYGMNFKYMPELEKQNGYLICIIVSAVLIIAEIIYFRKRGWLK
jgi:magnesium transporter